MLLVFSPFSIIESDTLLKETDLTDTPNSFTVTRLIINGRATSQQLVERMHSH